MKDDMKMCGCGMHGKKKGLMMLIAGILLILNVSYGWMDSWMLVGILVALGGLGKLIMHMMMK